MQNNEKIFAVVDWFDEKKGFGIAKNNDISLFMHSSYFQDIQMKINTSDVISCVPIQKNQVYHATQIEFVKTIEKTPDKKL